MYLNGFIPHTEVIHVGIVEKRRKATLVAYQCDPNETVWVPNSVIVDPPADDLKEGDDEIDIEVQQWWFDEHIRELEGYKNEHGNRRYRRPNFKRD